MAHAIFVAEAAKRGLSVDVTSAGIFDFDGISATEEAQLVCKRHNTPMQKLEATHISRVEVSKANRIFAMQGSHVIALVAAGVPAERITLLGGLDPKKRGNEIDDPMGLDADAFEQCYERLRDCIVHYLDNTNDFDR
jgi:protein-tyrosine-phosphatase